MHKPQSHAVSAACVATSPWTTVPTATNIRIVLAWGMQECDYSFLLRIIKAAFFINRDYCKFNFITVNKKITDPIFLLSRWKEDSGMHETHAEQQRHGNRPGRRTRGAAAAAHLGGVEGGVGVAVLRVGAVVAVGPEAVDAEVRRRLAGRGVAAALLGVAVGPGPLQHEVEEVVVLRRRAPGDGQGQQDRQGQARRHGRVELGRSPRLGMDSRRRKKLASQGWKRRRRWMDGWMDG